MKSKVKKVAVTGGNGFIASSVLIKLINENISALSLQRSKKNKENVPIKHFDLLNIDNDLYKVLCDVDVVIHTAALVHKSNQSESEYISHNYNATKNLFELCEMAKVKKFIFLSSVSVYGLNSSNDEIDIDHPTLPTTFYGKSKLKCENFLLTKNSQVKISILRLPIVYGLDAPGNFGMLEKISNSNLPLPFLNIKNKRSMISVDNVGNILRSISININEHLGLNLLAERKSFSTKEIITKLRADKRKSPNLFLFPKFVMKLLLFLIGKKKIYDQLYEDLEFKSTINVEHESKLSHK